MTRNFPITTIIPGSLAAIGLVCLLTVAAWTLTFLQRYKLAVRSGLVQIPAANEMEALFGPADHFISSQNRNGTHDWNTEIHFGGRYVLTMQVEVEVNWLFNRVTRAGEPTFYLKEVRRVSYSPNGSLVAWFTGGDVKFGKAEWEKLKAVDGDLTLVGMSVKNTPGVDRFDEYVRAVREPRISSRPH